MVKLKNKKEFIGRLTEMDVYMNIVLSSAEEIEDNKPIARYVKFLSEAIIFST